MISLKFAKNCLKNQNFARLFPKNVSKHGMSRRNPSKYVVNRANTERFKRSSIICMQKQLNFDYKKRKLERESLQNDLENIAKRKRPNDNSLVQVNYVPKTDYHFGK